MSTFNANRVNGLSNAMSNYMENKRAEDDVFDSDEFVVNLVKYNFDTLFSMLAPSMLLEAVMNHVNDQGTRRSGCAIFPLVQVGHKRYNFETGVWEDPPADQFDYMVTNCYFSLDRNFTAENLGKVSFVIALGHYNISIIGTFSKNASNDIVFEIDKTLGLVVYKATNELRNPFGAQP